MYEWAGECVTLRHPYAITGLFNVTGSRHFIPVFDALQDDYVREENVQKPIRSGGSMIADILLPWTIRNDPGPFMHSLQADDVADEHASSRTLITLRNCKGVKELVPSGKIDTSEIRLLNGYKVYINGPSLANFQTKGIRWLVLDEPWMYKRGMMGQAKGRVGDYVKINTSKILCVSQGGVPDSDWDLHYNSAEINEWTVSCLGCLKYFQADWAHRRKDGSFAGMQWDEHRLKNGDWHISKVLPTIRYACPHCGYQHTDTPRTKSLWNTSGKYELVTEANPRKKSHHWTACIDYPWTELVELWLQASNYARLGILSHKVEFYQKRMAQRCNELMVMEEGANLKRIAYEITAKRADEHLRSMSIDKQGLGHYWWMVRGWSKEGKAWRIDFGSAQGGAELEEIRIKHGVPQNRTTIDSAYEPYGDRGVFALCVLYGWIAVRGDKANHFFHHVKIKNKLVRVLRSYAEPERGDPEHGRGAKTCALIKFSKSRMNKRVQELLDGGAWEEPAGIEDEKEKEYNRQMAGRALRRKYDKKTNVLQEFWWEGRNDHMRDLANQQVLVATLCDILPDTLDSIEQSAAA